MLLSGIEHCSSVVLLCFSHFYAITMQGETVIKRRTYKMKIALRSNL